MELKGVWLVRRHTAPGDTYLEGVYLDEDSAMSLANTLNEEDGADCKNVEALFVEFGRLKEPV